MTRQILGLDVGGANLKAATPDGRAVSVPFALWKQPDKLPAALAELVGRFPETTELAVTMTGELCDCYETKRQGVGAILDAMVFAASGRPVRVWGTGGEFLTAAASRDEYLTVAAANWHALATFAGRYLPEPSGLLIDVGSTTTDIICTTYGVPTTYGRTDSDRLVFRELVYTGVRRTPVCALDPRVAAEVFATTLDVYLLLGELPEDPADRNTADGRPATIPHAEARLSRMLGGDPDELLPDAAVDLAVRVRREQLGRLTEAADTALTTPHSEGRATAVLVSGAGEFLARRALADIASEPMPAIRSLGEHLGPTVSACAPAYAVAVLAAERPS